MSRFLDIGYEAERQMKGLNPVALHGFVRGAEWADGTMIEKACYWLEEHGIEDEVIYSFKKAMEE